MTAARLLLTAAVAAAALTGCSRTAEAAPVNPKQAAKFVPVKPATPSAPAKAAPRPRELHLQHGRFFAYALPEGWRVGEEGQFAVSLVAPDQQAFTVMVGNAGLPPGYDPGRFVYEKLMALRPGNLQLGPGRKTRPVAGFQQGAEYDVSYVAADGRPWRGVAKCSASVGYDAAVYAMTAALSAADQWPGYARFLPAVADQIQATNGAAFGVRGVMAQNLQNSTAYGEAARQYREWSQKNWQGVTDARGASVDAQREGMREVLGGTAPYASPFGDSRTVDLPQSHRYFWMDRQGNVVGTDDPGANPNDGATGEWRKLERAR